MQPFSRERLKELLGLLNEQLRKNGVTGEICIVGGAAMILAFGNRNSTKDIDALLLAPSSVRMAVAQVADAEGLSAASARETEMTKFLKLSHLRVLTPPPEYILAMKCMAARAGLDAGDKEDAAFLIEHLGLRTAQAALTVVEKYYPADRIPAKAQWR